MSDTPLYKPQEIAPALFAALPDARQFYCQQTQTLMGYFQQKKNSPSSGLISQIKEALASAAPINTRSLEEVTELCKMINAINTIMEHKDSVTNKIQAQLFTEAVVELMESGCPYGTLQGVSSQHPVERPVALPFASSTINLSPRHFVASYNEELMKLVEQGARHCSFIDRTAFRQRAQKVMDSLGQSPDGLEL